MFEGDGDTAVATQELAIKNTDHEAKIDGGPQNHEAKNQAKILELLDSIKNRANTEELTKIIDRLEKQKENQNSDLSEAEIGQIIAAAQAEVTNDYLDKINAAKEVYQLLSLRKIITLGANQKYLDQTRASVLESAIAEGLKAIQDKKADELLKKLNEVTKTQSELEKFMREVGAAESNELINSDSAEKLRAAIKTEITNAYLININEATEVHTLNFLRTLTTLTNKNYIDQTRAGELELAITDRLKAIQDKKADELLARLNDIDKKQNDLATFMKEVDKAESNELINPDGAEKLRAAIKTEITNAYLININEATEVHTLNFLRTLTTLTNKNYIDQTRAGELELAITDRLKAIQDKKADELLARLNDIDKKQNDLATFMKEVDKAESNELINPDGADKIREAIRTEISKLI
ncbi:hypothetical protein KA089_00600 [Candidatus Woesebacteria bacterium]|nr:hypothetical protein [Candidatus Woesebacteria bacterium]